MNDNLDPGELLALADARAVLAPSDLTPLARPQLEDVEQALIEAASALDAALARIPAKCTSVPAEAFVSAAGREIRDRDPARFERAYLEARRDHLRARHYQLNRRRGELADPAFHARNAALVNTLLAAINQQKDPEHRAQREAHDHRNEALLADYHVRSEQRLSVARSPAGTGSASEPDAPVHEATTSRAFAEVLAAPGSVAARRTLLAEWQAAGDPRAALLEDQLAFRAHRQRGTLGSPEAQALYSRVNLAVARASKPLPGALAGLVTSVEYMRGLVAGVELPGARLPIVAPAMFALASVQHVTLTAPLGDLAVLFATPALGRLVSINLHGLGEAFGDRGAIALAQCPHLTALRWLALTDDDIGEGGMVALAASPYLAQLRYLDLSGNRVDPTPFASDCEGVSRVGRPPLAAQLERAYGRRPWLSEPEDAASWPPDRDELAITPEGRYGTAPAEQEAPAEPRSQQRVNFRSTDDARYAFAADVGATRWTVRINEFPEEASLYSLLVDGLVVEELMDWPVAWMRCGAPMAGT